MEMLILAATLAAAHDTPINCTACDDWNRDLAPFQLVGNAYYVGVEGLSSVLVTGDEGHVLIDGDLPQSAPLIAQHIEALGFRVEDVKWIFASHAHFDHVGGIAALARRSGAKVGASPLSASVLRTGRPPDDDPQPYTSGNPEFPSVAKIVELDDGEIVRVGKLAITVEHTPGHTSGGSSYRWSSCDGERCFDLVYADSLTAVSLPPFRYAEHPDVVAALRHSMKKVGAFPCDVLITAHPSASKLFERRDAKMLVDPKACGRYATTMEKALDDALAKERVAKP